MASPGAGRSLVLKAGVVMCVVILLSLSAAFLRPLLPTLGGVVIFHLHEPLAAKCRWLLALPRAWALESSGPAKRGRGLRSWLGQSNPHAWGPSGASRRGKSPGRKSRNTKS